ncbi:MAG: heavy metal-binding domain-containing protein [Gammaproteobacteria bacterium]|nr:heavy metal-binding domain-containing protein [Gammaproteobacteria bacterium]
MSVTTGLSGNEIFCLNQKNFRPGNIVVGNSVYSLGLLRSIGSGFSAILGGEIEQFTSLIKDGRESAYQRLVHEAVTHKATGVTGVSSELIFHSGNIEFLSIGSAIHSNNPEDKSEFTTSADAQELYAQLDAGYTPICFAFGNVAYSMGVGRGLLGGLKTLGRGEIKEYSDMFNRTRHLALARIISHANQHHANAVLGIQTTILPFGGVSEMLMVGTASKSAMIAAAMPNQIITSDMTNVEMWNMATMGYAPVKLLLGTSVYSLGFVGGITSVLKSFVRGEINELTRLIYDARENAIGIINDEAKSLGADDVVGVKTYVYQIGNGLIEFLAIGTAVKKIPEMKTESPQLPPQAIVVDKTTFYDGAFNFFGVNMNSGTKLIASAPLLARFFFIAIAIIIFLILSAK